MFTRKAFRQIVLIICLMVMLLSCSGGLMAQGENNNWRFCCRLGLDFNITPPGFVGGSLYPDEVFASISDITGNLLFSVSRHSVFDRNGNLMPNGLNIANELSAQLDIADHSCVIIPHPANSLQYYVVHIEPYWASYNYMNSKVVYSLIDMSLNNGLGDVVIGKKGIYLTNQVNQSCMEVFSGADCSSYWLVLRGFVNNKYMSFAITPSGIDTVPVLSPSTFTSQPMETYSHNATNSLVTVRYAGLGADRGLIEMAKLDKATGLFGNFHRIYTDDTINNSGSVAIFAASFSPDGKKLYCVKADSLVYDIRQLNLEYFPDTIAIQNSDLSINVPSNFYEHMRLGPDKKIYIASFDTCSKLNTINFPDSTGPACGFDTNAIYIPSNIAADILSSGTEPIFWSLQYNNTVAKPTDTVFTSTIIDTNVCPQNIIILKADSSYNSPFWNNDFSKISFSDTIHQSGTYWVLGIKNCIYYLDSFHVNFIIDTFQHNTTAMPICEDSSLTLSSGYSYEQYYWSNGIADSMIQINMPGNYRLVGVSGCNAYIDSFIVNATELDLDIGKDTSLCVGDSMIINAGDSNADGYEWFDGTTSTFIEVRNRGQYWVKAYKSGCPFADTIFIDTIIPSLAILESDTVICDGDSILLHAEAYPISEYKWNNTIYNTATYHAFQEGSYSVAATNICGVFSDSVYVGNKECPCVVFVPNAFSPNNDGINDLFSVEAQCREISNFRLKIFNRWAQLVFQSYDISKKWDGRTDNKPVDPGIYFFRLDYTDEHESYFQRKGDIFLLR